MQIAMGTEASPRFHYKGERLKSLRAFCQVARLGSVSRAAEALFLSQPAVTLQLQALERDFRPEAVMLDQVDPTKLMGDLNGTPEYRVNLIVVLARRALRHLGEARSYK